MANTYTPSAGTVAARVVAWLQARPTGEYNAAQIAEALKVDPKIVASSLEVALRERLVFHRQRDRTSPRAPWWYSAKDREEHARRNGFSAAAAWMPAPKKDPPDIPKGDQAGSEPAREVMEPEACESAAGRGTNGAPALATLPQHASPGVGPMGAGQPADAGPTTDESAAQQGNLNPVTDAVEPAAPAALPPAVVEQRREVDAQFAATLRAAMDFGDDDDQLPPADLATTRRAVRAPHEPVPLAFRAARFSDGTLATERDGIVVAVYSAAEVDAIQKLLGVRG